jgi:hypothetical protein
MDESYYLYALTWAGCRLEGAGPGVDPRFPTELVRYGQLAALASRVAWDDRDLAKLQEGSADPAWVSTVALRHHEIIAALARHWSVLPMRLGTLFRSRSSMIAKLADCEANAARFLQRLEQRQEWAVKLYLAADGQQRQGTPHAPREGVLHAECEGLRHAEREGLRHAERDEYGRGTQYLAAKGQQAARRHQSEAVVRQAIATVETRLQGVADSWQRLAPLSTALTHRAEKMVWNGALLLAKSAVAAFQTACGQLASQLAPAGLLLEATGPWPPYHFAPSLDPSQGPVKQQVGQI